MPSSDYPRADITGIVPSHTPTHTGVITAANGIDSAIENLRTGVLEFQKMEFEQDPIPLELSGAGAITISSTWHLIYRDSYNFLTTINGGQQGDLIFLQLAAGSAPIRIGNYFLLDEGQGALVEIGASSFAVIASDGWVPLSSVKAYRDLSTQSIAGSTATKVLFNATVYMEPTIQLNDCFNISNGRYQPAQVGMYRHNIQITWSTAIPAGTYIILQLIKNGATTVFEGRMRGDGNVGFCTSISTTDLATATSDYYEVYIQQNDASSHQILNGFTVTFWTATRLTSI